MKASLAPANLGRFVTAYAAAYAGATIAFIPLLVLILPLKAQEIAQDEKLALLSFVLLAGAVTASLANIAAGWISDKLFAQRNSRIPQITAGLCAILVSYAAIAYASSWATLICAVVLFQLSMNVLFSPLGALIADKVPFEAKGRTAALVNMALPIGTFTVAILTQPYFDSNEQRLVAITIAVIILIAPVLILAKSQPNLAQELLDDTTTSNSEDLPSHDLIWAWIARLCIQVSGAVMFSYLIYYLQDVVHYSGQFPDSSAEQGLGFMAFAAAPTAIFTTLLIGHFSDQLRARKAFLTGASITVGIALASMVLWPVWNVVLAAYIVFTAGLTVFLTIDIAIVTQLLARSNNRARTLGIMNLTNTLPSIIAPTLALVLSTSTLAQSALIPLFQVSVILVVIAGFAASRIRSIA